MDLLALAGAIIAFGAIAFGNSLEGGQLSALLDMPAFIIVAGGTLGATILQTPWSRLNKAARMVQWVLLPPGINMRKEVERLTAWSKISPARGSAGPGKSG